MKKIPVTVLILTKNEELAIESCLNSVSDFAQVIVVDSNSTDNTVEICLSHGAEVVNFTWNGSYPKKKQWSLELDEIRNNWVLFLDADERVSAELNLEIRKFMSNSKIDNFAATEIPILYYFMGKKLKHGHKVKKIALLNRQLCSFPIFDDLHVATMWEVEGHYQPEFLGPLNRFKSEIIHNDPDGLYDYFSRHNRYSDWEAELRVNPAMRESVRNMRTRQGRIFERIPAKPFLFFLYSYLFCAGWRDGKRGFNYAIALSFYYWQISIKTLDKRINAKSA